MLQKVPRPLTDRGKGSYWVVNDNVDPRTGVHRIRKKKAPSRGGSGGSTSRGGKALTTGNPSYPAEYPVDHTGNGEYRYEGDQIANGATSEGYAHTYDPEHPSTYPLVPAHSLRYPEETGEEDIESEVDKHGNPNWRVIWVNELAKLQAVTTAQDGAGGDPDWYRMMIERLRSAFTVQAPPHPQGAFDAPEHTQPSTSAHLHVQPSTDPTL
jgi:forkhead box protein J2/3